ncbi:LysR family transcriptional regulator [Pseudomonas cavernicola]|uniref:LysR family transcriptional regulator n=1 Tax=Pseudomonas cavernicola TaxID=2320866 RepID=A0A418X8A2_9PSED|nr:LysR family transcriptional regulator [Pseudomonas cavernicola]RJG08732.1 LysR family transcriptional regulator [Pseudomonas cavernicola]
MNFDERLFRTIDLNTLVTFMVVYRELGVSRAARKLNVTQPAVSNVLSKLRRRFGDPLFCTRWRKDSPYTRGHSDRGMPGTSVVNGAGSDRFADDAG